MGTSRSRTDSKPNDLRTEAVDATLRTQRRIQQRQDKRDQVAAAQRGKSGEHASGNFDKAVQAGAREQPVELPAQHLTKPGREADLEPPRRAASRASCCR